MSKADHRKTSAVETSIFFENLSEKLKEFKYFSEIHELDLNFKDLQKKKISTIF